MNSPKRPSTTPLILAGVGVLAAALLLVSSMTKAPSDSKAPPAATTARANAPGSSAGGPAAGPRPTEVTAVPATPTPPAEKGAKMITAIPAADAAKLPYPLKQTARWPSAATLPIAKTGVDPETAKELIAEARNWLAPGLVPEDAAAAIGRDGEGRVFLKLGPKGSQGLVSRDMVAKMYSLSVQLEVPQHGLALDAEALTELLEKALCADLIKELATEQHSLKLNPKVRAREGCAALALLDPNGCGSQYAYLYVYMSADRLVAVLQHVPHGTAPPARR